MEISLSAFFIYQNHCQMALDLRSNSVETELGTVSKRDAELTSLSVMKTGVQK